jgi:hypothetical protein
MSEHTARELTVFNRFAEVCQLGIDLDTIEKQDPPNPDILCRTHDNKEIAFEMVEAIDSDIAQAIRNSLTVPDELYNVYESLSEVQKRAVNYAVGNATISISYSFTATRRHQRKTYGEFFEELKTIDPFYEGDYGICKDSPLYGIVDKLNILRYDFSQPMFNLMGGTSWAGDPTIPAIAKKFAKTYEMTPPPDLLVYYEFQPKIAREDLGSIEAWVQDYLEGSPFNRVWGFEYHSGVVVFCFEEDLDLEN